MSQYDHIKCNTCRGLMLEEYDKKDGHLIQLICESCGRVSKPE